MPIEISAVTARRYVMGRQGLWPGRRWRGIDGAGTAMRAVEDVQLDPLVVVARAHDLALASRVVDYAIDDWAILTYERREFFEWGGWLAVRPMEELPYFRVAMRREREQAHWIEVEREHAEAIEEMRAILRSGREVSNRDFAMRDRTRIDDYRGRKDSALALHYLWRVGEAMVVRRERFERVYALTEAVAPAWALREVDDDEAEDVLFRKAVAADGLTKLTSIDSFLRRKDRVVELAAWRARRLADGTLVEVRVEGWRATQVAIGALWGDRLVGRFDPKLDRTTGTLVINGLWLEDPVLARDAAFAEAMARGMARFVALLGARRLDVSAVPRSRLRSGLAGRTASRRQRSSTPG